MKIFGWVVPNPRFLALIWVFSLRILVFDFWLLDQNFHFVLAEIEEEELGLGRKFSMKI